MRAVKKGTASHAAILILIVIYIFSIPCAKADKSVEMLRPDKANGFSRHISRRSPVKPVTITGDKPANLDLKFNVVYIAREAECKQSHLNSGLRRAIENPQFFGESYVLAPGLTSFKVAIRIDKFTRGRCEWEPYQIVVVLSDSRHPRPYNETNAARTFLLGDFGALIKEDEEVCQWQSSSESGAVPHFRCEIPSSDLSSHALKASGSMLRLKYTLGASQ